MNNLSRLQARASERREKLVEKLKKRKSSERSAKSFSLLSCAFLFSSNPPTTAVYIHYSARSAARPPTITLWSCETFIYSECWMLSLRLYFSEFVLLSPRDDFSLSLAHHHHHTVCEKFTRLLVDVSCRSQCRCCRSSLLISMLFVCPHMRTFSLPLR